MLFANRTEAGETLAKHLLEYSGKKDVLVLALPRGGVPVAYEVATQLDVPLDVFLVRKLGVPGHQELAMGAIATGGTVILNDQTINQLRIPEAAIDAVAQAEQRELERREKVFRDDRPPLDVTNKVVILVDDGLATGASMRAAAFALRTMNPKRIVVAVPIAAADTCEMFRHEVDAVVCAVTPEPFFGVGQWYKDFSQTTDDDVRQLLKLSEMSADARRQMSFN